MNTKNDNQPNDSPEANNAAGDGYGCMAQLVRLDESMIAWNPIWSTCPQGERPGQIRVCHVSDYTKLDHLEMWAKPNHPMDRELMAALLRLMIEAWHIACRDGVPIASIHEALSAIPEYMDILADDFTILETNAEVSHGDRDRQPDAESTYKSP